MSYRDDRQAMAMELAELERENRRLREALEQSAEQYKRLADARHEDRRRGARDGCALCGGSLLPVAVFAGHDVRAPLPLNMSTMRFGDPGGGFTHSAPIHALACASCGFIHYFIDIATPQSIPVAPGDPANE